MNKEFEHLKPTEAIEHQEPKRASIPTSERQGEEAAAVSDQPKETAYGIFRHDFVRGRDPELFWLGKYQNDDEETQMPLLRTDIRALYRHEDIEPRQLIEQLYDLKERKSRGEEAQTDFFANLRSEEEDELERVASYYQHSEDWKNRLILGDSLLVMNSLLGREGMAGQVQCIYFDPPYGINYKSNWQMKLNSKEVKDGDKGITVEPEMIKAFRDTWEVGINSYLSYLRDRLVVARELLSESGSCFIQISDDNVHLVRSIMDEVFKSENYICQIVYTKTSGATSSTIGSVVDYIIWYAKDRDKVKVRKLFNVLNPEDDSHYNSVELSDGKRITIKDWEKANDKPFDYRKPPKGSRIYRIGDLTSQTGSDSIRFPVSFEGKTYTISTSRGWRTSEEGMERLIKMNRVIASKNTLGYVYFVDDFPYVELNNLWDDVMGIQSRKDPKVYVVQTATKTIQRCILMTTDPGDLVLDPTCGSGTTAYVAEQWGRRWITIDTSRIALNIAKKRLTTAVFPYYKPFDQSEKPNIRQGFIYKTVPHITLKALANDLPFDQEILYDQPEEDKTKLRVCGPFTVETLQNHDVQSPESVGRRDHGQADEHSFVERIFANLQSNGIRNGDRTQQAIFRSMEAIDDAYLHARGYYRDADGHERLAYFHIGPKFGTVSKQAVNRAIQVFRERSQEDGATWLVVLGFSFEDNIESKNYAFGNFTVSKVRMSDDLLQEGLLKKDKAAGSFIIIGEPDVALVRSEDGKNCRVEIRGMDIYDPVRGQVTARDKEDIAYWEMDSNYSGTHFIVRAIHFCGGDKKEYDRWRKGLTSLAAIGAKTKRNAERTLRIQLDDEAWDALYSFHSAPIPYLKGQKIAVRVISQFGEESTKVLEMK